MPEGSSSEAPVIRPGPNAFSQPVAFVRCDRLSDTEVSAISSSRSVNATQAKRGCLSSGLRFGPLGLEIDDRGCELRQGFVGRGFLVQRFLQQPGCIAEPHLLGPGPQRAVAGDLVMLDGLRSSQQASVQRRRSLEVLDD